MKSPIFKSGFVAVSAAMKRVVALISSVGPLPYPVHILGETGTGKELVARAVHEISPRRKGPFVTANASAIAPTLAESELFGHVRGAFTGADRDRMGLFEQAHGGTLFLDEVEAMPLSLQEKLLRVLQNGEVRQVGCGRSFRVDVRIVSASNENLESLHGRFRRDLFYRLNVLRIDLPPLRDRKSDLPELVRHLLARIADETGTPARQVSETALERLSRHPWPGNVRELENTLRRAWAASRSDLLQPQDFSFLDFETSEPQGGVEPVSVDAYIRGAIQRFGSRMSMTELAERLGVSRKTLWARRKLWGIS